MDIKDPIVASVVKIIVQRSNDGIKEYGTTLAENNTDCFLTHLQEELMDSVVYLEKLINQKKSELQIITEFIEWYNRMYGKHFGKLSIEDAKCFLDSKCSKNDH